MSNFNINRTDKKVLLSNFFSLGLLQFVSTFLPLLTIPYLVRVLGAEFYGVIAFSSATVVYFQILIAYGFNLTGARDISLFRHDKKKLVEIYSAIQSIKLIFMFIGLFILTLLILVFDEIFADWKIFYLSYAVVVGQAIFPGWFFQGVEQMKYITFINICARLIFTFGVFVLVKERSDYYLVPALSAFGYFVSSLWSLIILRKKFGVGFQVQDKYILYDQIINGWHIFLTNISVSVYTATTTIILGIFTNNVLVGYYAAAEKLITALKYMVLPISQTLFPFLVRLSKDSKFAVLSIVRKLLFTLGIGALFFSITLIYFSEDITLFIFGEDYINTVILIKILGIIPFLVMVDTMLGTLTMLVFDRKKSYSRIILSASLLSIVSVMILVPLYQHIGAAISVLIVEVFISVRLFIYVQQSNLRIFFGSKDD